MKTKAAQQPKQSKPSVQVMDMKPKNNPKGGNVADLRQLVAKVEENGAMKEQIRLSQRQVG